MPYMKHSQESAADILKLDQMDKCSCPEKLEVMLVCLDQTCPDYHTLPFFCMKCSSKKHNHRTFFIVNEVESQHEKWSSLKR